MMHDDHDDDRPQGPSVPQFSGKRGETSSGKRAEDDGGDQAEQSGIIQFPSLADRDRIRKEKEASDKARQAEKDKQQAYFRTLYRQQSRSAGNGNGGHEPFFNMGAITPFVKITVPLLVLIHAVIYLTLSNAEIMEVYRFWGFVPASYSIAWGENSWFGPISHLFIHGSWMHLVFNVIMLGAFGIFTERQFGTRLTVMIFLFSGLGGAALHFITNPYSAAPVIGASGAISGFFGVFLILMYKRGAFQNFGNVRKYGALPIIGFWVVFMLATGLLLGGGTTYAWAAHIGGFLTGIGIVCWLLRKDLRVWRL